MTNSEKAKFIRETRQRMGWTQERLGLALNLDSSYISQLETDRRPIDDFYVGRIREIEAEFEKSNSIATSTLMHLRENYLSFEPTRELCVEHLQRFLDTCTDKAKVGWTLVELQERFPLNKWKKVSSAAILPLKKGLSLVSPSEVESALALHEAVAPENLPKSLRSPRAGGPSGEKGSPSTGVSRGSKEQPVPPKPAPRKHGS